MSMTGHQSTRMGKDEWLTPPEVITALGEFDLDPCSPGERRPWDTAKRHYGLPQDGLLLPWEGRVWCNPPYGAEAVKWLKKLADHGNGVALIFARTETKAFFEQVWDRADALLFLRGRLTFHHVTGEAGSFNGGGAFRLGCLWPGQRRSAEVLRDRWQVCAAHW